VDKLSSKVEETEAQLQEQVEANKALTKALNESKSKEILRKICEGLTQVQIEKINTLAEGVEFTTEGEYSQKISVIRENYFPTGKKSAIAPQALVETKTDEVTPAMDAYVSAISRIVK
jgi:hypothetical protein